MTKRIEVIRWSETKSIFTAASPLGGAMFLVQELWQLDPDVTITLKHISGSFGIQDDPTDERLNWHLGTYDPDNLPNTNAEAASDSAWLHNDSWRSIGTDSGPIETTTERDSDLDKDSKYSSGEIGDNLAICMIAQSTTTSSMITRATVNADIEYRQARYNNDEFGDQAEELHAIL